MEPEKKTLARNAESIASAGGENKPVVKTYAEDMAEVLESDTEGLVKKLIHGAEEKEAEKKNLSPESKKNRLFLVVSLILLSLGAGTLFFFMFGREAKTVPIEQQFIPLVFNDRTSFVEVSEFKKSEIEQTVLNQVNKTEVKKNGIEGIYLTLNNKKIGLREFISLIESSFAPAKEEQLISDNFLLGVVNVEEKTPDINRPGFFILLKTRSVADIFDSLRLWEPKMFSDLHEFLGIGLDSTNAYLLARSFEDGIVENKNARLLLDKDNNIVLLYVFADNDSVVITNSPEAVREIQLRLSSAKTKE